MIGLATIQALAEQTRGRAEMLVAQGQQTGQTLGAEQVYDTFLSTLGMLVFEGLTPLPGWARTLLSLCGRGERPSIDAAATSRLEQGRIRLLAILDLPNITTLTSLADAKAAISAAIEVGAPRYNGGDILGCSVKYWAVGQTLALTPSLQESAAFKRALEPLHTTLRTLASIERLDRQGVDDLAWDLRNAFDATLETPDTASKPLKK